jgi:RNA polymerase sigma-70 factor (ECF subfamily)
MNVGSESDESLMSQVKAGKRESLTPLVRRYANRLLTFIQRMIGDAHRSEELFQEVFLAVWQKRRHYDWPRPFRPWLYAIAMNKCREDFRRRTVPAYLAQDNEDHSCVFAAPDPPAGDVVLATETAEMVTTAVRRLPPRQRAVVVLRVWEELSYGEIAEVLGRSEATVRSNMHHGLARMREYLEPRLR